MRNQITIGLRYEGREYWAERWARLLSDWLMYVPFLEGEAEVIDSLVVSGTAFDAFGRELSGPRTSDYGFCIFDFDCGLVFSRTDYLNPSELLCNKGDISKVKVLYNRGYLRGFSNLLGTKDLGVEEGLSRLETEPLILHMCGPLQLDHVGDNTRSRDVRAYLNAAQWKT